MMIQTLHNNSEKILKTKRKRYLKDVLSVSFDVSNKYNFAISLPDYYACLLLRLKPVNGQHFQILAIHCI